MSSCSSFLGHSVAGAISLALANCVLAGPEAIQFDVPTLDRWNYAFNPTPGVRITSSTFGAFGNPSFDNRDAQMLIGYDTSRVIPTDLDPTSYNILSARVIVQNEEDLGYIYDASLDSYTAFLDSTDPEFAPDEDPGQPMEIWGAGFRNGWDVLTFLEDSPYSPGDPLGQGIRNAFALGFNDNCEAVDVSLGVEERINYAPWAIGAIDGLASGEFVPIDSEIIFDIDVSDPNIQGYFQESLSLGMLDLTIASYTLVEPMKGDFPSYYNKEHPLVEFGFVHAARLELEVMIVEGESLPADLDLDGDVDFADLLSLLAAWRPCDGCCVEDLDDDGEIAFSDLLILLSTWS